MPVQKKAVRTLKTAPKPKGASEPADAQLIIDSASVISEHLRKLGKKASAASAEARLQKAAAKQRRGLAMRAAKVRWSAKKRQA